MLLRANNPKLCKDCRHFVSDAKVSPRGAGCNLYVDEVFGYATNAVDVRLCVCGKEAVLFKEKIAKEAA